MELLRGILKTVFVIYIIKAAGTEAQQTPGHTDTADEVQELRTMLKTVLEHNRRLVLQNNRIQQVWFGMQQMCKAITMPACNCSVPEMHSAEINGSNAPNFQEQSQFSLQVMSIKSSGENSGITTVTVTYAATNDHTTEWLCIRTNGGMWRTSGTRTQSETGTGSTLFTSTVDVEQIQSVRTMFFRLNNEEEGMNVRFNLTELEQTQQQNVTAPTTSLLKIKSSYTAPLESDLNITAIINMNATYFHDILDYVEVSFTSLNTSANPSAIFEFMNFNGIGISASNRTENTSNMNIVLLYPYVQYGGILSVRMPYRETMTGMIERLYYGPTIKIYAPDSKEVVPNNSLGMFPLEKRTVIFPPRQSIMCAAMGHPRPNVTILKIVSGGKTEELPTETVILDSSMNIKVLSMSSKQPRKTDGRYICRATNGNETIEVPTEVVVLNPAVFDEGKTGVTKNTSTTVIISCKAKGKPRPDLALRLYEEYGPDLIKSDMFSNKVVKSEPNKYTSRVSLRISPVDDLDIHTVYCTASQGGPNGAYEVSRKIDVYPGMDKEINWELLDRLHQAQLK